MSNRSQTKPKAFLESVNRVSRSIYRQSPLIFLGMLGVFAVFRPILQDDTNDLLDGVNLIRQCISEGHWKACDTFQLTARYNAPLRFPLLQVIFGLLFSFFELSHRTIAKLFVIISFLSFCGCIALFRNSVKDQNTKVFSFVLLITGPLIYYSRSSFSEMVSAFLILFFTCSCVHSKRNWVIIVSAIFASLTKETSIPFLLLIGFIVSSQWKVRMSVFLGVLMGIFTNSLFNVFKYGTFYDRYNLSDVYIVKDSMRQLSYFFGLWFSPSGGVFFFWFSFFAVFAALTGSLIYSLRNSFPKVPILGVYFLLFGLTVGFSRWYAPFGWIAWGPRLLLPWIPSVLLILLSVYSDAVQAVVGYVKRWPRTTLSLLFISTNPTLVVTLRPSALGVLFPPLAECPTPAIIQENPQYYFMCLDLGVWPKNWAILRYFSLALHPSLLFGALFYFIVLHRLLGKFKDVPTTTVSGLQNVSP